MPLKAENIIVKTVVALQTKANIGEQITISLDPNFLIGILVVITICAYVLILRKLKRKPIPTSKIVHVPAPEVSEASTPEPEPTPPQPVAQPMVKEVSPPAPFITPTAEIASTSTPAPASEEPTKTEKRKKPRKSELESEESASASKFGDLQKRAFMAGREAALKAGWKPFTKMTKKQKQAFQEAYNKVMDK